MTEVSSRISYAQLFTTGMPWSVTNFGTQQISDHLRCWVRNYFTTLQFYSGFLQHQGSEVSVLISFNVNKTNDEEKKSFSCLASGNRTALVTFNYLVADGTLLKILKILRDEFLEEYNVWCVSVTKDTKYIDMLCEPFFLNQNSTLKGLFLYVRKQISDAFSGSGAYSCSLSL